jgi:hypothetical protein
MVISFWKNIQTELVQVKMGEEELECMESIKCLGVLIDDDLNSVVVGYADCYSKGPGFESRVSHGLFQKV